MNVENRKSLRTATRFIQALIVVFSIFLRFRTIRSKRIYRQYGITILSFTTTPVDSLTIQLSGSLFEATTNCFDNFYYSFCRSSTFY